MDTDGNPLGVQTTMKTKDNSSDKLTLTLRHEPTKPNSGDLASAGGETDIEVEFDVEIQ